MLTKKGNRASFIVIIIIICLPFLSSLAYKYRFEFKIKQRLVNMKNLYLKNDRIVVRLNLVAGVNDRDLRLVFCIPCKDIDTKLKIIEHMAKIQHEMLMSMDDPQNKISIEKRDFKKIKANCITILTKYAAVDVRNVYVEFFAHN